MEALVEALLNAVRTRTALDPASIKDRTELTPEAAYDIQDQVIAALGGKTEAAKLGLTSRAKQVQMNVDEPSYGWLLAGSRIQTSNPLKADDLIQPRAEPEIAFVIGDKLAGDAVTAADVLAATEGVMPAIDILDSRYAGYSFTLPEVIADNASAARYALGNPVSPDGINLRTVGCVFIKNGHLVATAAGAAVLDDPAEAIAWFVRKLSARGRHLEAGNIVLSGALTAAVPVTQGDEITVEIDRLGRLDLHVA
ncbi:MAG: 2-keto-4-pentenoate hydratase [Acidimicrobiia bacterium]